ncbi:MAG: metallophosphatase family protein [Cytophagaceae bacterium]|jgi:hypothetical protein|nr:metallophosphatase family protein [Cytophagaceae bacterium]
MKIGLLSDTHSFWDEKIEKYLGECDEWWHAGDFGHLENLADIQREKKLIGVYGNIDDASIRNEFPENQVLMREGLKILITHIAGSPGKYPARVKKLILDEKPNVLVCGHSHILRVVHDPGHNLLYLNPGAAGHEGFHKIRTLLRFEIIDGKIEHLQAIELGKRGKLN